MAMVAIWKAFERDFFTMNLIWGFGDVEICRCGNLGIWGCENLGMWRCENLRIW